MTPSATATKAWIATAYAIVSALIGSLSHDAEVNLLTILIAVLAGLGALGTVYAVPNSAKDDQPAAAKAAKPKPAK